MLWALPSLVGKIRHRISLTLSVIFPFSFFQASGVEAEEKRS
jgi:hypothetical protein